MKKLITGFLVGLLALNIVQYAPQFVRLARAGVACSVPFNLTNGTTADATQVMANFNALLACFANNTAASGANSDITSLNGLTTPLSPSSGGTTSFNGTASGTNAIVVSGVVPNSFALNVGNTVSFVAAGGNTAATTVNVAGTGIKNLFRQTPGGPAPMVGGEIASGQLIRAQWDGTQYQMISPPALPHAPGEAFDYVGASCPTGSLEATGASNTSQTLYPTLFGIVGTIWGASGSGIFTIPDLRGRTTFNRDSGGSGRITVASGNFDGTTVGNTGGVQARFITTSTLPNYNLSITDPGHSHSDPGGGSLTTINGSGALPGFFYVQPNGASSSVRTAGNTSSNTTGITVNSAGGNSIFSTLSNGAIVLKCIKG